MLNQAAEVDIQRKYYAATAHRYYDMHNSHYTDEHYFALSLLLGSLDYFGIRSILDVGAGIGRAVAYLKTKRPDLKIVGVEPVEELRQIGRQHGIPNEDLIDGDALNLHFRDGEFDMVCEFGVLHHIRTPGIAVSEMLRVAKKAVFISDANNFGQGSAVARAIKQLVNAIGLWKIVDLIKTKGKGYSLSEGDGLSYSYSAFNSYSQIRSKCMRTHVINTSDGRINPYRSAGHVALLGVKSVSIVGDRGLQG
jgi:SAM-dependent methyltransferase